MYAYIHIHICVCARPYGYYSYGGWGMYGTYFEPPPKMSFFEAAKISVRGLQSRVGVAIIVKK